jgi:hypothetical protein
MEQFQGCVNGVEDSLFVLFLSNPGKKLPLWNQTSSSSPEEPVIWDYHVILCSRNKKIEENNVVFDFDTCLSFPCSLKDYVNLSFRPDATVAPPYRQ